LCGEAVEHGESLRQIPRGRGAQGRSAARTAAEALRIFDIVGMPKMWHSRLIGCWWLIVYCATHCSLVRDLSDFLRALQ
jgi:hypothetical protein